VDGFEKTGSPDLLAVSNSVAFLERLTNPSPVIASDVASIGSEPEFSQEAAFMQSFRGWVACDAQVTFTIRFPGGVVALTTENGVVRSYLFQNGEPQDTTCRVFEQGFTPSSSINLLNARLWTGTQFEEYTGSLVTDYDYISFASLWFLRDGAQTQLTTQNAYLFSTSSPQYVRQSSSDGGTGGGTDGGTGGGGMSFVSATTRTAITHINPGTDGVGANLQVVPATWDGIVWSSPVSHTWLFRPTCTTGN
jgi:hypothetical protein